MSGGSQPPYDPSQVDKLRQLIKWLMLLAFGFSLLSWGTFVAFRDARMVVSGLLIFVFGCLVLVAWVQVSRGRWRAAIVTICAGILGTTLAVVPVQPAWFPTLAVTPLITVMVALPYVSDRYLRYLLVASWIVTVVVATLGRILRQSSAPLAWYENVFIVGSLAAAVATVLLLLWQFRRQLTQMLAQTRAAEERYALAARAANDGLWDWDLTEGRVFFSSRWKEMLGYREDEIGDKPEEWFGRVHPDDRARVESKLEAHLEGLTENFTCEHRIRCKDGGYRWILSRGIAVRDEEGKPVRIAGSQSDIHERRRAEEESERRAAELASSNAELEQFAHSVSHDLRSPLRGVNGFAQILLEDYADRLDDQGREYLRRIRAASQRMGRLIDDLLDLSRVNRAELRRERVDLSAVARTVVDELKQSEPERRLEVKIADGLVTEGDSVLLRVVLENLIGNAWKFTRNRPVARIEFGAQDHDGERVYYVRDNGAGFDMAYAGKLFGAFQRLHAATEFEGTGMGLATVQRIIERHGGQVWAEGEVGRGATFYFTL